MALMEKFYITTAIPYVNAKPHIGHALEFIQADAIARYRTSRGDKVLLLSGSDENALKNVQAAEKAGIPLQTFIDENAKSFLELAEGLNVRFDVFQKGSSKEHHASSQKLWELCARSGDIYKKSYEGLNCVGCEAFYTPDELNENGECAEHPGKKLEVVSEENYFFRLSRYQTKLIDLLREDELRVVPLSRKNEVLSFLKQPLQDISVSRSNERAKNWGVPVPGDHTQRMYVWFDALNIYQSGVGFGLDEKRYAMWWPADVHVIGKGITRFHAVYWPAFLLSAGLSLPKTLFVHGYITVNGQKMSKTLGNVVDPFELTTRYGTDATRYFFLRENPPTEDGDFSNEKFKARYNADLAGGLGNLTARVLTMARNSGTRYSPVGIKGELTDGAEAAKEKVSRAMELFQFNEALAAIWEFISLCDKYVDERRPWEAKEGSRQAIAELLDALGKIADMTEPFLPATAEEIREQIKGKELRPLFARLP